jgi:hypothetical protein
MQIDLSSKRDRNLSVLQKIDSNVLEIVSDASHTAIYKFDAATTKWERFGVEGSAFITRNCQPPLYSLIVMNKQGESNVRMNYLLTKSIEKKVSPISNLFVFSPFLCMLSKDPMILCWI